MEYIDPIETARKILSGEPISEGTIDIDELEAMVDSIDEGKIPPQFLKKKKKGEDEDEEDEVEVDEDDNEDEDEDEDDYDYEDEEEEDDEDEVDEGSETKTLDTKSEEDKDLYKSADGKGAKVAKPTGASSSKNKGTVKSKSSSASGKVETPKATKEHIEILFSGEELSEEFKTKATTIFEAAIHEHVSSVEGTLREEYTAAIVEHTENLTEELSTKLDDYLGYVVEQWMKDNELAIESGIKNDIAENFLVGLRDLFERHYVDLPEDKSNILEAMAEEVISMQNKLEGEIQENISLKKELSGLQCEEILTDVSEGLVDTDAEKLKILADGLEFESADQYKEKIEVLKEYYFTNIVTEAEEEDTSTEKSIDSDSVMGQYTNALGVLSANRKSNQLS